MMKMSQSACEKLDGYRKMYYGKQYSARKDSGGPALVHKIRYDTIA